MKTDGYHKKLQETLVRLNTELQYMIGINRQNMLINNIRDLRVYIKSRQIMVFGKLNCFRILSDFINYVTRSFLNATKYDINFVNLLICF